MVLRRATASAEGTTGRISPGALTRVPGWRDLMALAGWHSVAKAFVSQQEATRTAETETRSRRTAETETRSRRTAESETQLRRTP